MRCYQLITRLFVFICCLVLVACGGDEQDLTCKNCLPLAKIKVSERFRIKKKVTLDGRYSTPGPDATSLTYFWQFIEIPGGSKATLINPETATPHFYPDLKGLYIIQLIVHDGNNESQPAIVKYTPLNTPPVARATYNSPLRINETVLLDARLSSDEDYDPLTFKWSIVKRPNGSTAELSDANAVTPSFLGDQKGDFLARLIVNDGQIDSEPFDLTITIYGTLNPLANAEIIREVPLNEKLELDGSKSEPGPNSNSLKYFWQFIEKPATSKAILINPEKVNPYFYPDIKGLYVIQLIVHDGIRVSEPSTIEFIPLNTQPVARAFCSTCYNNNSVRVSDTVLLNATSSEDIDQDPLTCHWEIIDQPDSSAAVLSDANAVTPSFIADKRGEYIVQLIVNDGQTDSEPFNLNIQVHENPVAIVKIVNPARIGEKLELDGSQSSPGSDSTSLSFRWTLSEKPEGSKSTFYNSTKVISYFFPDIKGLYVIQLIVNDGISKSKPAILEFTPLNSRPVAHATYNDPVRINDTVLLNATTSEDADNDPLKCKWKIIRCPQGSSAELSDANSITPSFIADSKGEYIVQLIVNDGLVDSEPFILYIQVHDNPVAKATFEQQLPVMQKVQLDGSESKPSVGGGELSFQWKLQQKPSDSNATLSDPTSAKPTFVPDKSGKYVIQLVVNDGISDSPPFLLEYETLNSKPIAVFDYNRPIYVNQTVELDASQSSDLDNDPLTYKWALSFKPPDSHASLSGATGPKPSFLADRPGKYVVQLIVNDGKEDSETYTLPINTENSKPVANAGNDVTVFEGEDVQLDASQSSDADGSPLSYKWSVNEKPDGSSSQLSNVNKINPVITPDVPGLYVIQLVVNDGKLDSDPDTMEIFANASVDLKPGHIDLSSIVTDPDTLLVTGTVHVDIINTGSRPIPGAFQVILFEDINQNNQFENSDPPIAASTVQNKPEGNDVITVDLIPGYIDGQALFTPKVSFLDNVIFVMIDPLNSIPERDETNNIGNSLDGKLCKPPVNDFSPRLAWEWTKSLQNDFPTSNQVVCTPIIGNLTDDNNDGKIDLKDIPDIVFITFEGSNDEKKGVIRAISGDGSAEHFSIGPFSYNDTHFEAFPNYNPALGDIDNDGVVEILVVVNDQVANKWLAVFENNGTLKWISQDYSSSQMTSPASVSLADLDANGISEIIIGNFIISNTGQTLMIGKEDNGLNNSTVADIDLDSQMEIVAGRTAYEADGTVLWHINELSEGFSAVANFDNDDYPEIVLVGKGRVSLVEHTGEIIWGPKEIAPGGPFRGEGGPPMISDVDGDGKLEIGIAGASKFSLFNANGSQAWTADIRDPSSVTSASAFDFDGDGCSEIVYRDSYSVKIFNGRNGELLYEDPAGSSTFIEMPVIADVDNDNSAEIIVPCNSYISGSVTGIRVYEDTKDHWVNTRKIWNQHAYVTTNIHEDGRIPQMPINNWEIYNNFRQNQMDNPFGCKDISSSYIRFDKTNCPDSVLITARIGNSGSLHVPPDTKVSFYLGNPNGNGRLLEELTLNNPIQPGQWVDLSITMDNPGNGINNIFVVADSNDKLWESNENNNVSQRSFTCASQ